MRLIDAAADLLLGASCPGCEHPGWGLCQACRAHLEHHRINRHRPDPCPDRFPDTWAAAEYDVVLQRLLRQYKERGAWQLQRRLGACLARSVGALLLETAAGDAAGARVVLVPAPSADAAVRERGMDATAVLARSAAAQLGRIGVRMRVRQLLRQGSLVADQSGLDAQQRAANLAGGLRLRGSVPTGAGAILVDDLVTTGATLVEMRRVVEAAGMHVLGAAVVAATQRRS